MLLSIDFGTCNSSATVIENSTLRSIKEPLKHGYSFPSSVYLTEQEDFLIGQAAENNRLRDRGRYRTKFKKELGSCSPCILGDRSFSADELVTEVLRKLKIEAEKTVPETITNVVITIPATYLKFKRDLMQQAAQAAGFTKITLLEEPVAAAIYYTRQYRNLLKDGDIILVYDLGGGTFDASLIKKQGDWFQTLGSPMGLENCGGTDFDREIYQDFKLKCSRTLQEKLEQENAWRPKAIIGEQCINLKHQLSEDLEATIDIPLGFDEIESYHLTRANFDRMIAPLIAKTIDMCDRIIQSAGLDWRDLHSVLMVGGSCRIPYVQQALQYKLGHSPLLVDEPELAVCQGAAIYQDSLEKIEQENKVKKSEQQQQKRLQSYPSYSSTIPVGKYDFNSSTKIIFLGYDSIGKTSYSMAMYSLLVRGLEEFSISADENAHNFMNGSWDKLVNEKKWPCGTNINNRYLFSFNHKLQTILDFEWMDHKGGALNDLSCQRDVQELADFAKQSSCVFLGISGEHLQESIIDEHGVINLIVKDKIASKIHNRRMLAYLSRIIENNRSTKFGFPVVIIITKFDLILERSQEEVTRDIMELFSPLFAPDSEFLTMICPVSLGKELYHEKDAEIEPINVHIPIMFAAYCNLVKTKNEMYERDFIGKKCIDNNRKALLSLTKQLKIESIEHKYKGLAGLFYSNNDRLIGIEREIIEREEEIESIKSSLQSNEASIESIKSIQTLLQGRIQNFPIYYGDREAEINNY